MLVLSHKIVFIENEAAFTMHNYAGTLQGHLQLQSSVKHFDITFAITKFSFCGALFKQTLAKEQGISKR